MRDNKDILAALNGQEGTSLLIKIFVMVSVAFGIASVLIVTVVQKSREIGILKSMGARTRSITLIFLLQGLFVGLIGSLVGCVLGSGLVWLILQIPGEGGLAKGKLFPAELEFAYLWQAFAVSVLIGMLAGIAPARRAAQLDPVEVIRYG
jgi:lipoprotein-releasing system permease protein